MPEQVDKDQEPKSKLPEWLSWLLIPLSLASFCFMFWHLYQNNAASAGAAAAVSFACLGFRFLPDLESFQVLGMEMRLRRKLAEADDLMKHLQKVAEVQTCAAVLSIAYSNRMGGMSWDEKGATHGRLGVNCGVVWVRQTHKR